MIRKTQIALLILELVQLAASDDNETTLSAHFMERLLQVFPAAEAASVWLYLPDAAELTAIAGVGYEVEALRQIRLPIGASFARSFYTGHSNLYASPVETAELMEQLPALARTLYQAAAKVKQPNSVMTAPLHIGETKLGMLVLENLRGTLQFKTNDLERLDAVANLLALIVSKTQLQTALREVQAVNEASNTRKESIAFLAHEMRTPLTSIKGYATALLMEEVKFDVSTQREFLEHIDRECDSLIQLIEDLLESSLLDAGMLELELQPVQVPQLVKEVVDEVRQTTTRHHFFTDFSDESTLIQADPTRLAQVVRNLLENAVKYSPEGGLIVIRSQAEPHQIVISIADQGVGIAPEHLNRLFEKFFRVKSDTSRATIGSGLGLPIARSIVQAHDGKIWAESQPEQGSTFYFMIPLAHSVTEIEPDWDDADE